MLMTDGCLIGIAAFLNLIVEGQIKVPEFARLEAEEHLNRLGDFISKESDHDSRRD